MVLPLITAGPYTWKKSGAKTTPPPGYPGWWLPFTQFTLKTIINSSKWVLYTQVLQSIVTCYWLRSWGSESALRYSYLLWHMPLISTFLALLFHHSITSQNHRVLRGWACWTLTQQTHGAFSVHISPFGQIPTGCLERVDPAVHAQAGERWEKCCPSAWAEHIRPLKGAGNSRGVGTLRKG